MTFRPNPVYCALQYLHIWATVDKQIHEMLHCDAAEQLEAVSKAVRAYKIARNLPKAGDSEVGRYKPVVDALRSIDNAEFEKKSAVMLVSDFSRLIKKKYGKNVDSLSSKLLWLKFKDKIIIYDNLVKSALDGSANYSEFYGKWNERYVTMSGEIDGVCRRLPDLAQYTLNPEITTSRFIKSVCCEQWFKNRVFDIWLWNVGSQLK